jgi:hypothetical protein
VKEQLHMEIKEKEQQIREVCEENIRKECERREAAEAERTSLREQMDEAKSEFEKQKAIWAQERQQIEEHNQKG